MKAEELIISAKKIASAAEITTSLLYAICSLRTTTSIKVNRIIPIDELFLLNRYGIYYDSENVVIDWSKSIIMELEGEETEKELANIISLCIISQYFGWTFCSVKLPDKFCLRVLNQLGYRLNNSTTHTYITWRP